MVPSKKKTGNGKSVAFSKSVTLESIHRRPAENKLTIEADLFDVITRYFKPKTRFDDIIQEFLLMLW